MIKSHLKIGNGPILNMADSHGLVYISSDSILSAPLKAFEETSYPEQEGANINPKTVEDAFDYTVKFYVRADGSLGNANQIIRMFNKKLVETEMITVNCGTLGWSESSSESILNSFYTALLSNSANDDDSIPANISLSGYSTLSWEKFVNNANLEHPTEKVIALHGHSICMYDSSFSDAEDIQETLNGVNVVYEKSSTTSVKTYKKVEFYNDYKRVKIVGYPNQISEATDFWRDSKNNTHDIVLVEWKIRVNKPSLCNFSLTDSEISSLEPQSHD